uniref:SAM domain-containing protein n=1 Tax=Kalanchoe fedtschenkoi TaxID=63787 RepID=A0A7N0TFL5_KALFE
MDWFKWLSKSNLDPSLVDQYAVLFSHNELQEEDIPFFNHEFLQSMGITIAKHRLEILKLLLMPPPLLLKSNAAAAPISRVLVAVKKTKKSFSKYILNSLAKHREDQSKALAVVPVSDDTTTTANSDRHGSSTLGRGLSMLRRSSQKKMPAGRPASARTTPDPYYYSYKNQPQPQQQQYKSSAKPKLLTNGGSPMYASTPRIGSFSSSSPFRHDCLQMVDTMNGHDYNKDDDLDEGYWSAGVEETRWDAMFHNLKPT